VVRRVGNDLSSRLLPESLLRKLDRLR